MNQGFEPPELGDAEFREIRNLVFTNVGIHLTDAKKTLVVSRLGRRLRELGLPNFAAYIEVLRGGDPDGKELEEMLNRISTNKTDFFREPVHFRFLETKVFREFSAGSPLRVWSAASSTGEEVYSIAMTFLGHTGPKSPSIQLLASDISTRVLAQARTGIYDEDRIEQVEEPIRKRYFLRGTGAQAGKVALKPQVRDLVRFDRLNLMEDDWNFTQPWDVVFLRNVLIYFDKPTKQGVIQRIRRWIRPGGYLIIGLSDSLLGIDNSLDTLGHSIYQRPRSEP